MINLTEFQLGAVPLIGGVCLLIGCFFYMWGGRDGKWRRRFLGSFILSCGIWFEFIALGKFNPWYFLIYPLTALTFSLGYGADVLSTKIFKRSVVVLASLVTSLLICTIQGGYWLLVPEFFIAATTVFLGVKNPISAAPEEFFVCLFLWSPKLMYPFIS